MHQLQKLDDYRWLVPKGTKPGMLTDALIYTDERLLQDLLKDLSLEQAINVAMLPGIVGRSLAMPDIHQGYGFPIGGVAATLPDEGGVISPGGVGFDINCGVRLLASTLTLEEVRPKIKDLINQLFRDIPSGAGRGGDVRLSHQDLDRLLAEGAAWMVAHGYGRAEQAAQVLGLYENEIVILIHSGSRGFGHQVCTDYLRDMDAGMRRYGIELPDRQLACVPVHSKEGQEYLAAMRAAANFAWANRQGITHLTRQAFKRIFGEKEELRVVYDVCHNIAKLERHNVGGRDRKVMVHRKGATRAFPAGRPEVPEPYKSCGQPVLIPGSMGTASYVLVGAEGAMRETFGTTCHGAGRVMSRTAARKSAYAQNAKQRLEDQGIIVRAETRDGITEEIPEAYKDVDVVIDVVHNAGLARRVARLRPIGVIKG
ncbi:MAG: RtcB family protein [Acidobacteriia bacterium]|nr:RtcB family protein [Terriglobia bacterium]